MTARSATARKWDRYLAWNAAVAEVVYPESSDAAPAYMDLDGNVLHRIAELANEETSDPRATLAEVVADVTVVDSKFSLKALDSRTRRWRVRSVEAPPCLAFLLLTVSAAEDMGNTDEGLASTAYYARLARLLGLKDDCPSLRAHYMRHSEFMWKRVNRWLENLEGDRGAPTAFALSHRYVGLPMSQALVRETDRQRLPLLFSEFGLNPGMQLSPNDLTPYLAEWLESNSSSATANLRHLWRRHQTHDRIATIAALELASWDGAQQTSERLPHAGRALLVADLRTGFLSSALDLSLGIRPVTEIHDGDFEVLEQAGTWSPIAFGSGPVGMWRSGYAEAIDFGSVLEGVVRFRHTQDGSIVEYRRDPRQIVPMVYDDLQSAYIQAERLQLGVDSIILVRSAGTDKFSNRNVAEIEELLTACARPGFTATKSIDGLPEGWTLFKGVQLFRAPAATSTRFNELVPLARNQLTVAGGLQIPSRIRKWSALHPPEIRATVQGEESLRVTLQDMESDQLTHEWESTTGTLAVPLKELDLADGDYQISLFVSTRKIPNQQFSLRLRSSDNIDELTWNKAPRLKYSLNSPLGVLGATEDNRTQAMVDGLYSEGSTATTATVKATETLPWTKPAKSRRLALISIGSPDPTSCVATGAHRIQLPIAYGGPAPKFIHGHCTSCGLVKRYPGWLPRNGTKAGPKKQETDSQHVSVTLLPPVAEPGIEWDAALDALVHMGGGPAYSLERIARQLDGSSLFVDRFIRSLESLGHIAVERTQGGQPIRWELSPACIAQVADGRYKLTGCWARPSVQAIASSLNGATVDMTEPHAGPTEVFISAATDQELEEVSEWESAVVVPESGRLLLQSLPRLSEVADALARTDLPGFEMAERYDLESAAWVPTGDLTNSGAYRIKRGFETRYGYRSEKDLAKGTIAYTTVYLAKHLAANESGKSLAFYKKATEALLVPRGCELPGLYDRAAVAFSGSLPNTVEVSTGRHKRRCLQYPNIDSSDADLLLTLLTT